LGARSYWVGFNHVAGVGPARFQRLREHFSSLEAAWHADKNALQAAGLDRRTISNLLEVRQSIDLNAIQRSLDDIGAAVLTLDDTDYPALLRELPDAPPVIYVRGSLTDNDNWTIAIVGTRKASSYGRDTAYELAGQLANDGITIVSGLALGIDAAAHRGALETGGRTIAVLPCGIDHVYPPEHRKLAQEVANNGALVTEFPPGTYAEGKNFPRRNRSISGLSLGVIVVEAPEQSGALITADSAAEQGREVFAIPGRMTAATSRGSNRLIQDGAKLVLSKEDILDELNLTRDTTRTHKEVLQVAPSNDNERLILEQLSDEPIHIDELCRTTALPIATLSSTLTLMELKSMVRQTGNMQYTLARGYKAPYTLD
jgi:DNA processing protein